MTKIFIARARIDDAAAMKTLIGAIPGGDSLWNILQGGETGRTQTSYCTAMRTAYYVVTDNKIVVCFTVTDLSLEQAVALADACDDIAEWSTTAFVAAAKRAIGGEYQRVH